MNIFLFLSLVAVFASVHNLCCCLFVDHNGRRALGLGLGSRMMRRCCSRGMRARVWRLPMALRDMFESRVQVISMWHLFLVLARILKCIYNRQQQQQQRTKQSNCQQTNGLTADTQTSLHKPTTHQALKGVIPSKYTTTKVNKFEYRMVYGLHITVRDHCDLVSCFVFMARCCDVCGDQMFQHSYYMLFTPRARKLAQCKGAR